MGRDGVSEPARRIALVTPEWTSTEADPGPQALLNERLAVALVEAGWTPEVFAPADKPGTVDDDGITVHRVRRGAAPPGMPLATKAERVLDRSILAAGFRKATNRRDLWASTRMKEREQYFALQQQARTLGEQVEVRQREAPFQAALTTDADLTGLFVPARRSRPHILRLASDPDTWAVADEDSSATRRRIVADQRKAIRQAQRVIASSEVVATTVAGWLEAEVPVLRPPAPVDVHTGTRPKGLPRRYLAMCGPIDRRHGAETLAAALPLAWRRSPDLHVVLAGTVDPERLADWRAGWRDDADRVTVLEDLGGGDLVAIAARAVAVVAPALADDVDETAQQALAAGVPVITTAASGTAELLEGGRFGRVVPTGSPARLGDALADAWSGEWGVPERIEWRGPVADAMRPAAAVASLLALISAEHDRWREETPHG
jgi:glycosyltransferase involved in cell wall biosynthesis